MADREWSLARPGILVTETAVSISMLRVVRDDTTCVGALSTAFGHAWPEQPNTVMHGNVRVAWMAPGQWAVFGAAANVGERVAKALNSSLSHLADVSAGRRLWRIEGVHARTVLAKGCSIDTHSTVMPVSSCARTLFAQVPILLLASATGCSFEIVADVSFAGHLEAWFTEATLEFLT